MSELRDYVSRTFREELYKALERKSIETVEVEEHEIAWKGRKVCLLKLMQHGLGIILRPMMYVALTIFLFGVMTFMGCKGEKKDLNTAVKFTKHSFINILVSPIGQAFQASKAFLGIFYPFAYLTTDSEEIVHKKIVAHFPSAYYGRMLAAKAIKAGAEGNSIGISILNHLDSMSFGDYEEDIEEHLRIIHSKIDSRSDEEILSIISFLAALKSSHHSPICPAGIERTLLCIVKTMEMPNNHDKIVPYLVNLFKLEIIEGLAARFADGNTHGINEITILIGSDICLSKENIASAKKDPSTDITHYNKGNVLETFYTRFTKDAIIKFLKEKINRSKKDAESGHKFFRQERLRRLMMAAYEDNTIKTEGADSGVDPYIAAVRKKYYVDPNPRVTDDNLNDAFFEEQISAEIAMMEQYQKANPQRKIA